MKNKEKVIIFSHGSDIDGVNCVVLANTAFDSVTHVLAPNPNSLEEKFRSYLESGKLNNYDYIFVTDLALFNPSLDMVANSSLKDKTFVFDHHKSSLEDGSNKYPFTTVIVEEDGVKTCGTKLFYNFLVKNNFLKKCDILDEFVELTRLEDVWEWKKVNNPKAHELAILFNEITVPKYIEWMNKKVETEEHFNFNEIENFVIENKKEKYMQNVEKLWNSKEIFEDENGNKIAVILSPYEYRNELGEYGRTHDNEGIKYVVVIAFDTAENGQKSYRSVDTTIDVGKIAEAHNGRGHFAAAGVNITNEQKRKVMDYIINSKYDE